MKNLRYYRAASQGKKLNVFNFMTRKQKSSLYPIFNCENYLTISMNNFFKY